MALVPAPAPPAWYLAGRGVTSPYPQKAAADQPGPQYPMLGNPMLGVDAATAVYEPPRTPPPASPWVQYPPRIPPTGDLAAEAFANRVLPAVHPPCSRAVVPGSYYVPGEPSGFGRFLKPVQAL